MISMSSGAAIKPMNEGHESVGGLRASLYNALSVESVNALPGYLYDFAQNPGS